MNNFEDFLRKNGSKATPGRIAILTVLKRKKVPMSISDLVSELPVKINQTTLYRALESLAESGIVRKVDLGHAHIHYEMIGGVSHHHHIVCNSCGKIEDVQICRPHKLEKNVLKHSKSFRLIKSHALEFFGVCNKCIKT